MQSAAVAHWSFFFLYKLCNWPCLILIKSCKLHWVVQTVDSRLWCHGSEHFRVASFIVEKHKTHPDLRRFSVESAISIIHVWLVFGHLIATLDIFNNQFYWSQHDQMKTVLQHCMSPMHCYFEECCSHHFVDIGKIYWLRHPPETNNRAAYFLKKPQRRKRTIVSDTDFLGNRPYSRAALAWCVCVCNFIKCTKISKYILTNVYLQIHKKKLKSK